MKRGKTSDEQKWRSEMRDRKKSKVKMSHCGWRMLLASCKVGNNKTGQKKKKKYRCRGERRREERRGSVKSGREYRKKT